MAKLTREFFLQPTLVVAQQLLGRELLVAGVDGVVGGRIVETEAYLGADDPAAHSFRGQTPRTKMMFGAPGVAYVYFVYGLHTCLNVVTAPQGVGHAVLIRALEPTRGIKLMQQRRGQSDIHTLCSGPAKLTEALGVTLNDNGTDILASDRFILGGESVSQEEVAVGPRIGIRQATELPYRFYVKSSSFVSGIKKRPV